MSLTGTRIEKHVSHVSQHWHSAVVIQAYRDCSPNDSAARGIQRTPPPAGTCSPTWPPARIPVLLRLPLEAPIVPCSCSSGEPPHAPPCPELALWGGCTQEKWRDRKLSRSCRGWMMRPSHCVWPATSAPCCAAAATARRGRQEWTLSSMAASLSFPETACAER